MPEGNQKSPSDHRGMDKDNGRTDWVEDFSASEEGTVSRSDIAGSGQDKISAFEYQ